MLNLFAIISSNPNVLIDCKDPIGENDSYLKIYSLLSNTVVFAWGSFKESKERAEKITRMFPDAMALHINKDGSPKHPLYVKSDVKLIKYFP